MNRPAMTLAVALVAWCCTSMSLRAQTSGPTNSAPNPYTTIEHFFKMPEGRTWGSTSAVEIDKDGRSIWVAERCGANTCLDRATGRMSNLPSILKFDASGKLVASFGQGLLIFPHGIYVDRDGNVWVTDGQDDAPQPAQPAPGAAATRAGPLPGSTRGHQVFKFSPEGKLLMTMGKAGGAAAPDYFYQPDDVLVAPNGDIFISEGHGGANSRILKFNREGKFLMSFGSKGAGPTELDSPHALAMDSRGRLFVGDRANNRIQIYDQSGKLLDSWSQFSRPSGLYIDKQDMLYVADSESESVSRNHDGWKRGIRVGSARDGKVLYFIPDPDEKATGTRAAVGVAVYAQAHVYRAEQGARASKK